MEEIDLNHQMILVCYFGVKGVGNPNAIRQEVKAATGIDKDIHELTAMEVRKFFDAGSVVTS